jgi:hypothetical protein
MSSSAKKGGAPPGELIRVRSGDGSEHLVSRASLVACDYFRTKLAGWESGAIELDVDDASLRVVLTLLRYGAEAVPSLSAPLRAMVLKDVDYLGVPKGTWLHLAEDRLLPAARDRMYEWEQSAAARFGQCKYCSQYGLQHRWCCVGCGAPVDENRTCTRANSCGPAGYFVIHECGKCGIGLARRAEACLVCGHDSRGRRGSE